MLLLLIAADVQATPVAGCEAELALARLRDLYVVVDPDRGAVAIKIRGQVFVTLRMTDWGFLVHRRESGADPPAVTLPTILRVAGAPGTRARRIETVAALRPFDEKTENSEVGSPPPTPPRLSEFDLPLDSGWVLRVAARLPPTRGFGAWKARFADGWASWRGRAAERPPLFALAVDGGARLYHVLRPGTAILVCSPTPGGCGRRHPPAGVSSPGDCTNAIQYDGAADAREKRLPRPRAPFR